MRMIDAMDTRTVGITDLDQSLAGLPRDMELDDDAVQTYAENFTDLPMPLVYEVEGKLYLVDGRHRVFAAQLNGDQTITTSVRQGSLIEAEIAANEANLINGVRLTKDQQRRARERVKHLRRRQMVAAEQAAGKTKAEAIKVVAAAEGVSTEPIRKSLSDEALMEDAERGRTRRSSLTTNSTRNGISMSDLNAGIKEAQQSDAVLALHDMIVGIADARVALTRTQALWPNGLDDEDTEDLHNLLETLDSRLNAMDEIVTFWKTVVIPELSRRTSSASLRRVV